MWRPKDWVNDYSKDIRYHYVFEYGADVMLLAYLQSDQFIEDASNKLRELGWKEPDQGLDRA